MIKIDRLIDKVNEQAEAERDYRHSCRKYRKRHPFKTIHLDNPKNDEERHIIYASGYLDKMNEAVCSLCYVLDFSPEQNERLFKAARAMRKWYEKTEYQFFPSDDLNKRIAAFIIG